MPADSTQVMTCAEAAGGVGASVAAALDAGGERFLVEVLPPGLNPELEMTCPYDPSRELAVVQALLNAIPRRHRRVARRGCLLYTSPSPRD